MKYLYKYPQAAYPYDDLVAANRGRSRTEFEYELSTGVFDHDRYFDVFVEYAKAAQPPVPQWEAWWAPSEGETKGNSKQHSNKQITAAFHDRHTVVRWPFVRGDADSA